MNKVYVIKYEDYCESSSEEYLGGISYIFYNKRQAQERLKDILESEKIEIDYEENKDNIKVEVESNYFVLDIGYRYIKYSIEEFEIEDSMKKPLWLLKQEYEEELQKRRNIVEYNELTIKEVLELGFNNNYLQTSFNGEIELGYVDENGDIETDLNEEQLSVKVKEIESPSVYIEDEEGYSIMSVICIDSEDEKLFIKGEI